MAGENLNNNNEVQKKSNDQQKTPEQQAKEKVVRDSNVQPGDKIDNSPLPDELSSRKRVEVKLGAGERDISKEPALQDFNQSILDLAKKNMTFKPEYGDIKEITVANTVFVLGKRFIDPNNAEKGRIAYVSVYVKGLSSGAVIQQDVPLQMPKEDDIIYNTPPLSENDVKTIDPEVKKIA